MFIEERGGRQKARKFVIKSSPSPQEVPNWVADVPSFQRAVKAKAIVGVRILEETDLLPKPLAPKGRGRNAS